MQGRFKREDVKPYYGRTLKICGMEFTLFEYLELSGRARIAWLHVIESGDILIFATPYTNDIFSLSVHVFYREDGKLKENEVKMGEGYFEKPIETITEYCEAVHGIAETIIKEFAERIERLQKELTVTKDGRRKF